MPLKYFLTLNVKNISKLLSTVNSATAINQCRRRRDFGPDFILIYP